MNIYDIMSPFQRFVKYDGLLGVEIETETVQPYEFPRMKFWNTVADGSLRNFGVEYVLNQPLNPGRDLDAALAEFEQKTNNFDFLQDSVSTSVHVHINFLHQTFRTLVNFLTVYSLMENLLIKFSGPDRLSNLFCLPICDAEEIVRNIIQMLGQIDNPGGFRGIRLGQDQMKYGALNLAAFPQRGSLEVRSFRGVTDTNTIRDWATVLSNMLEYSKREITPVDIVNQWRDTGLEMIEDVFGDKFTLLTFDDSNELVQKNLWYAAQIASFTKDWSKFAQFQKKTKSKGKKNIKAELDNLALNRFGIEYDNLDRIQRLAVDEEIARQVQPVVWNEMNVQDFEHRLAELQFNRPRVPRQPVMDNPFGDIGPLVQPAGEFAEDAIEPDIDMDFIDEEEEDNF